MSTRRHKRRRVERETELVFEEADTSPAPDLQLQELGEAATDLPHPSEAPDKDIDVEASTKEQEIWDAFREEQYEILEQLPLSLHRVFTLIHELDQQAQERISNLTPAILKYVFLRKTLAEAGKEQGEATPAKELPSTSGEHQTESQNADTNGIGELSNGSSLSPPPASTPGPPSVSTRKSSDSTRELLISIAQSAEEVSRASNEKYHLARHVYDLVDRHIRDLDRAIKEQEASISLGLRPGTHPASITLPELIIPKANRNRIMTSPPPITLEDPIEDLIVTEPVSDPPVEEVGKVTAPVEEETAEPEAVPSRAAEEQEEDIEIIEIVDEPEPDSEPPVEVVEPPPVVEERKGRKRRKSARARAAAGEDDFPPQAVKRAQRQQSAPEPEPEEEVQPENQPPLTLRIPAQTNLAPQIPESEMPDPDEPRYCFCNQVSYGEMIACDNPECTREWFHMGCVGLTRIPKGKWYCRDCADVMKKRKGKRRHR
ncbi:hypothetical protein C8Q74DRAFT_1225620 [Fomes fomentarius]|nr:hypothetical protein C8Q74DRAFT_1225620 [Fomes fomentarius]